MCAPLPLLHNGSSPASARRTSATRSRADAASASSRHVRRHLWAGRGPDRLTKCRTKQASSGVGEVFTRCLSGEAQGASAGMSPSGMCASSTLASSARRRWASVARRRASTVASMSFVCACRSQGMTARRPAASSRSAAFSTSPSELANPKPLSYSVARSSITATSSGIQPRTREIRGPISASYCHKLVSSKQAACMRHRTAALPSSSAHAASRSSISAWVAAPAALKRRYSCPMDRRNSAR